MRHRDQTSTNPNSPFSKDDRPLQARQTKGGKWEAVRADSRRPGREKIVATGLASREEANTVIEREQKLVPRTDTTKLAQTRSQFTFEIPEDKWNRIFGSENEG